MGSEEVDRLINIARLFLGVQVVCFLSFLMVAAASNAEARAVQMESERLKSRIQSLEAHKEIDVKFNKQTLAILEAILTEMEDKNARR